jgi:hypothetical protein
VDSAEADRLVARDSASARTPVSRFMRACGITVPLRRVKLPLGSLSWGVLLQAAAATAQPIPASSQIRPAAAPSACLPRQTNPPSACPPPCQQLNPPPAPAHHSHPLPHRRFLLIGTRTNSSTGPSRIFKHFFCVMARLVSSFIYLGRVL